MAKELSSIYNLEDLTLFVEKCEKTLMLLRHRNKCLREPQKPQNEKNHQGFVKNFQNGGTQNQNQNQNQSKPNWGSSNNQNS